MNRMKKTRGLTLIETLVVCVIIGILFTAAIPSFQSFTENLKTEKLAGELFDDLNSSKITAISTGLNYSFEINSNGWLITSSSGSVYKRKTLVDNNLYIENSISPLIFEPLGIIKDNSGNTVSVEKIKICNANNRNGQIIEINRFGKSKIEGTICY